MDDTSFIDQSDDYETVSNSIIDSDEEDDDIIEDEESVSNLIKTGLNTKYEIISNDQTYEKYYSSIKKSKPFLTKYEKAKLIGVRAQMISNGSRPMIVVPPHVTSTQEIAILELKEKKIPLLIRRYLPNKEYEDWRLEELIIN